MNRKLVSSEVLGAEHVIFIWSSLCKMLRLVLCQGLQLTWEWVGGEELSGWSKVASV